MTALVRHAHFVIRPGGGPSGYLHNLRAALAAHPETAGPRLEVVTFAGSGAKAAWRAARGFRSAIGKTPGLRGAWHRLRGEFRLAFERVEADWWESYAALTRRDAEALLACDLFFAHETLLAERLLALCPRLARERVVLMTHAPGFYAHQIAAELLPDAPEASWSELGCVRRLRAREVESMLGVKAVLWPSPGAAEGYPDWRARASVAGPFVTTGVPRPEPRSSRDAMRARWGVAAGRRVALFLGRPHPHKGFDIFLDWAESARAGGRWDFVHAGGPARFTRRDLGALRQVGYENDNGGAYAAADLVVFPNRHAYLDIGLLECLSLGVPAVVSPVGGHADLVAACPELLACAAASDAWTRLEVRADEAAEPGRRARLAAAWAERYSPEPFLAQHRAAAEALLS